MLPNINPESVQIYFNKIEKSSKYNYFCLGVKILLKWLRKRLKKKGIEDMDSPNIFS